MRARYYDANLGRFISEDPAGFVDGTNLYAYVGGNPVMLVDPSGLTGSEVGRAGSISVPAWARNPIGFAIFAVTYPSSLGDGTLTGNGMFNQADDAFDTNNSNTSNPFRGEPGDVSQSNNSKGNKSQERLYGDDGYPDFDIDYDHSHGNSGMPHGHQWDRPADGSPPKNSNRGPGFPL